jgi:serine/threonine protein kinase
MSSWSPWGSGTSNENWTPMLASVFAQELAHSHPHYVVERLVGHGGMGAVYFAEDRHAGRRVAVKMLRPDALDDDACLRRFDREIASLERLEHVNCVRILDAGTTRDGYRFLVMEWLDGRPLAKLLEGPRLPQQRVVRIMADICAGLQHVHEQGLVHRDLKATNIFIVNDDGRAVLLDFGIARDVTVSQSTDSMQSSPLGTYGHMAPEVREGKQATRASDVFSLGVVLLHILNGTVPDVGHTLPSELGLEPRLDDVVKKALRQEPADRYRTAADFAVDINESIRRPAVQDTTPELVLAATATREEPHRADQKTAVPQTSEKLEVQFADLDSVERHKAFFAAYVGEEQMRLAPASSYGDETWLSYSSWDAGQPLEKSRDGRNINPPVLVGWSPDGRLLFSANDAWGLKVWRARDGHPVAQDGGGAYGYPLRFFVTQRGEDHYRVLQETSSNRERYYLIHDGAAVKINEGITDSFWGFARRAPGPPAAIGCTGGLDPWRPGSEYELAVVENYSVLKIVNVTRLAETAAASRRAAAGKGSLIDVLFNRRRSAPDPTSSGRGALAGAGAAVSLDFGSLGARDKTIFGFHWHPSGEYIAVHTGDWENREHRRSHIVHVRSGLIVASVPPTATGLRWSPTGRYLLVKRWRKSLSADGRTGGLQANAEVWDATRFESSVGDLDQILSQPWALHGLHSAPTLPTDSDGDATTSLSLDGRRMLIESGTVITSVERDGCTVRSGQILARIAGQPFAHVAWSPTDSHCFVTVGGESSKKYPETYRYCDRQHGRLLRVWRLVAA